VPNVYASSLLKEASNKNSKNHSLTEGPQIKADQYLWLAPTVSPRLRILQVLLKKWFAFNKGQIKNNELIFWEFSRKGKGSFIVIFNVNILEITFLRENDKISTTNTGKQD